jgi:hypothetical protein
MQSNIKRHHLVPPGLFDKIIYPKDELPQLVKQIVDYVLISDENEITGIKIETNKIFDKLIYPLIDEYASPIISCDKNNIILNDLIHKRDALNKSIDITNNKIKDFIRKKIILDKMIKSFKIMINDDMIDQENKNIPSVKIIKDELIKTAYKMIIDLDHDIQMHYLINDIKYKNIYNLNKYILALNISDTKIHI